MLSPGQIASPTRGILRKQPNATVLLGEVTGVDIDRRYVFVDRWTGREWPSNTTIYRIHRSATPDAIVFALSGDMDIEHATWLAEILAKEPHGRITLDLKDVTLVDRDAVRFLLSAEADGIRIVNCPEYVRSWITAESDGHEQ